MEVEGCGGEGGSGEGGGGGMVETTAKAVVKAAKEIVKNMTLRSTLT